MSKIFLSYLDLGDDIAGSLRQPAHFCGIFTLKPTDRRVSTAGHIPEVPGMPRCIRQMLTVGPLARSIEDLTLCLQLIAGSDLRQPDIPPVGLETPAPQSLQALRIAWTDEFPAFGVASEIRLAMQAVANTLVQTGVQIEQWVPPGFDFAAALQLYNVVVAYTMLYSQPVNLDAVGKTISVMFREWTQGDKELRSLYSITGVLPTFLNPTMKGYFQALEERDLPKAAAKLSPNCPNGASALAMGRLVVPCSNDNRIYAPPER
ncbi:MAG: amidase family protein [Brasilonema sp.]